MKTVFGQNTVHPKIFYPYAYECVSYHHQVWSSEYSKWKLRHAGCQRIRGAYANEINGPGSQKHLFTN